MKHLVLAAAVWAAGAVAALAQVAGNYYAYGRNPDGSAYSGTVAITDVGGGSYDVAWSVGTAYSGRGQLEGRVLTVHWGSEAPAVYVVMPNGELHGTWAGGTGLELLTRTPR